MREWIECNGQGKSAFECLSLAAEKRDLKLLSIVFYSNGEPVVRDENPPEWLCEVESK